jgi:hypothetical protein
MKIFVATREGQDARQSDFCDAEEGELLTFAIECDRDEADCDGNCGCRRSLLGLETGGATTTFTVAEIPLSAEWYEEQVIEYFADKGWFVRSDAKTVGAFRNDAKIVLEEAARFPVGVVLEKRGDEIKVRMPVQTSTSFMTARSRQASNVALIA